MSRTLRLAALISGGGRTLLNLIDAIEAGRLPARIDLVISSRAAAPGVERVRARGLDVRVPDQPDRDAQIATWLRESNVDLACMCGYLRLLPWEESFNGRIINIHPALLPDFGGPGMYGDRVHAAVLASGARRTGCTVHFVDAEYDHGPVILQRHCEVRPDDDVPTLAQRVFREECIAYPQALRLFAEERVHLTPTGVVIDPTSSGAPADAAERGAG